MSASSFIKVQLETYVNSRTLSFTLTALVVIFLGAFTPAPARSQHAVSPEKKWNFQVVPYFVVAGLNGTVSVKGNEANVDAGFSDIKDHIDKGFMAAVEARHGRYFLFLDIQYVKFFDTRTGSLTGPYGTILVEGIVDATPTQQLYQPSFGYRVVDDRVKVDAIAGARYTHINGQLDLKITTSLANFPGAGQSVSDSVGWWDAVIGSRATISIARNWTLMGYGDIGGGGSAITYQGLVLAKWQFRPKLSASGGYRYIHQDYSDESFKWKMSTKGIMVGLGFNF